MTEDVNVMGGSSFLYLLVHILSGIGILGLIEVDVENMKRRNENFKIKKFFFVFGSDLHRRFRFYPLYSCDPFSFQFSDK